VQDPGGEAILAGQQRPVGVVERARRRDQAGGLDGIPRGGFDAEPAARLGMH
jgi:hypothetical protein